MRGLKDLWQRLRPSAEECCALHEEHCLEALFDAEAEPPSRSYAERDLAALEAGYARGEPQPPSTSRT